jgi:hypothetical protein
LGVWGVEWRVWGVDRGSVELVPAVGLKDLEALVDILKLGHLS